MNQLAELNFEKVGQKLTAIGARPYTTLDHLSTSLTGTDPNYEIAHTHNSAVGTPDVGGEYARMNLHYTINYQCKRNSNAFQSNYYSSAYWSTNSSQGPWIFGPTLE